MTTSHILPDGSAFFVGSLDLPKDHWIYRETGEPPRGLRCGMGNPLRQRLEDYVRAAAQYAVRGATMSGTAKGFDPDALVQNMIVGLLGYYTEDGVGSDERIPQVLPEVTAIERNGELT